MKKLTAAMLLLSTVALAQTKIDIPYAKFTLPNGLTVLVHEDHKAPIVAVNTWYHVGSKNERRGKTGFAHLYEHLMFGGSENLKGSFTQALQRIGATTLNGTTNEDRTNYFENVPTNALDYTLFLESDRMGHFIQSFDKATLDVQRGVVQNEKRQGLNEPYGQAWEMIPSATFPAGHPYSWSVIGAMEDLNAASLDDVKEWFSTYYGPSNTVLVLAGDIDLKTAREKVTKYYGDIPAGRPLARPGTWVAKMSGTHRETLEDRVPEARILKFWNTPGLGSADADYLDLVSNILAKSKISRLYQRLVYTDQTATAVDSWMDAREIAGQFAIDVMVAPGKDPKAVEAAIDDELAKLLKEGPTAAELQRVQTQFTANFLRSAEMIGGFGGKSDLLALGQILTGDPAYLFETSLPRHQTATPALIKDFANRWLADGQYVLTVLPFSDHTSAPPVERKTPPAISGTVEAKPANIQRATLKNGTKVILAERHELPLVSITLTVDAGYAADSLAIPGTASLTSKMLSFGTKTLSTLALDEQIESLGAQILAYSTTDSSEVQLSALKDKLDPSLALFADVALHPAFPAADFAKVQRQHIASIQEEKSSPMMLGLRVLPPLLFGANHAYSVPFTGSGSEESAAKITTADLQRFHSTWYRPNNATLIVVGDITMGEILPKLETAFTGWAPAPAPKKNIAPVQLKSGARVYLIDRPGSEQSVILSGLIAPPQASAAALAGSVADTVLGGNFSSRLNMNIREDKHYSYGVGSFIPSSRGQRPYFFFAPVQTDKTRESLMEVSKELQDIVKARPVTAQELQDAKSNMTLKLPGTRATTVQLANTLAENVRSGLPDDYFDNYAKDVMALKLADVDDAARTLIQPDKLVWVIVGDRSKIEAGIRSLNLGPLQILDANGNPVK